MILNFKQEQDMKKLLEEVLKRRQEEVLEAELEARAEAILIERGRAILDSKRALLPNTTAEKLLFRLQFTALMIEAGKTRAANKSFSKAQDFCRELIDQGH